MDSFKISIQLDVPRNREKDFTFYRAVFIRARKEIECADLTALLGNFLSFIIESLKDKSPCQRSYHGAYQLPVVLERCYKGSEPYVSFKYLTKDIVINDVHQSIFTEALKDGLAQFIKEVEGHPIKNVLSNEDDPEDASSIMSCLRKRGKELQSLRFSANHPS